MRKRIFVSFFATMSAALQCFGCDEHHVVGAPCQPGEDATAKSAALAISCVTKSDGSYVCEEFFEEAPAESDIADVAFTVDEKCGQCDGDDCIEQTITFDNPQRSAITYGYCSCPCMDREGHNATHNDSLCECPETTVCMPIGYESPAYCVPSCMAWGCMAANMNCVHPKKGADPWQWTCEAIPE